MKLTGEYFSNKLNELAPLFQNLASGLNDSPEIMDILAQIARDAAEAQREKCAYQVCYADCQNRHALNGCPAALAIPDGE